MREKVEANKIVPAVQYVIDTNIFITPYQSYYGLDFAIPFWDFLTDNIHNGTIICIDKVAGELNNGRGDALSEWFNTHVATHCINTVDPDVLESYQKLINHVDNYSYRLGDGRIVSYTTAAREKFADAEKADAWLLAYCLYCQKQGQEVCLVTQEILRRNQKKEVPIPNVCEDFNIPYCNLFQLIRNLQFAF